MKFLDEILVKIFYLFLTSKEEYIFFIGTTLISILFYKKRKFIAASIVFSVAVIWVVFHRPFTKFLNNIGIDSFYESRNFDMNEAIFWIKTIRSEITPNFDIFYFIFYVIIFLTCLLLFKFIVNITKCTATNFYIIILPLSFILIILAVQQTISNSINLFFQSSKQYFLIEKNFKNEIPNLKADNKRINLVVYIGESTSIMNMGLYGYQRDTTPNLNKISKLDSNLLVFNNVFSTHTHTTPSLLEALSLGVDENEKYKIIEKRKRISIVDILSKGGIESSLISNQGMTGTFNLASSVLFKNAHRVFSTESRHLGNNDPKIKKPRDDVFFNKNLKTFLDDNIIKKEIIFLHSYAGHGDYLYNIPSIFRDKIDNFFIEKNAKAIVGKNSESIEDIEGYDSAIKYIDFSVSESIGLVKKSNEPTIFLYFADHGDAVYAGRGHDSSRFIHEMARVPFLLYFNDAARIENSDLFEKYKKLADKKSTSTLAQLPATILDLIGVQLIDGNNAQFIKTKITGEDTYKPPIIVRETTEGTTYIDINKSRLKISGNYFDKTDDATKIYLTTENNISKTTNICYHRSNTLGKALRGQLVSDCLEIDLFLEKDGALSVYHPPAENTGLELSDVFNLVIKNNNALWIDVKNLQSSVNCSSLRDFLMNNKNPDRPILIEFPSGSHRYKSELDSCAKDLRNSGFFTSYYVPTQEAVSCSSALTDGRIFESESSCRTLNQDLKLALASGIFTDFSFDYRGIKALEHIDFTKKLHWNTWNVTPSSFDQIIPERFRMVILSNSDPNDI